MSEPLPTEAFYDQTLPNEVAVSPDGSRLAYVARAFDGRAEVTVASLFVVPTDGSRPPHRLSRASGASSPAWSPDGSRLAFLASRETDRELAAERTPEPAGDGDGDADRPSGASNGGSEASDEQQVWTFDLERGGDARQLTDREEGVEDFDWAPDGDRIVVLARDPTAKQREAITGRQAGDPIEFERLQHKVEGRGYLDGVARNLFVVDVASREVGRLDGATVEGVQTLVEPRSSLAWGEGGIAYGTHPGENPDDSYAVTVHVADPESGDVRTVTRGDWIDRVIGWSPEGDRLAVLRGVSDNWYVPNDLCLVDPSADGAATGAVEPTILTAHLDRTVLDAAWVGNGRLVGRVGDRGTTRCYEFAPDADPSPIDDADDPGVRELDASPGAGVVGFVGTSPTELDVFATTVEEGSPGTTSVGDGRQRRTEFDGAVRLTEYNGAVIDRAPVECARVTFENDDGIAVEGIVYAPGGTPLRGGATGGDADTGEETVAPGNATGGAGANTDDPASPVPDGPLPLVVDVHGGPRYHNEPEYWFPNHFWTSRGYLVLKVNYRGSTSYGRAFSESIRGDWGPRETDDVVSGIEHLVGHGLADPDRVFVTGFSSGARITAYVLSRTDVAAAGAVRHGVYDPRAAFGSDDSHAWWTNDFGTPWENPEGYDAAASITDVDGIDDPLLVTGGGEDLRCPLPQAEQLYVSVRKRGEPAKLVIYPESGHEYWDPRYAPHRLETMYEWFREHDPGIDTDGE